MIDYRTASGSERDKEPLINENGFCQEARDRKLESLSRLLPLAVLYH